MELIRKLLEGIQKTPDSLVSQIKKGEISFQKGFSQLIELVGVGKAVSYLQELNIYIYFDKDILLFLIKN
jgi:hypothetical protein